MAFIAALVTATSGDSAASQGIRKDHVQKMSRLSGLPGSAVVSVRQGLAIAIRERGVRGPEGIIRGVELHGEVIDPAVVSDMGFSSMTSRVDVDCAHRRDRVVSMEVYPAPGLEGRPERRPVPGGWVQPSPQAYLADVLRAVCGLRRGPEVQVASLADEPDLPIATAAPKRPTLRPAIGLEPPPVKAVVPAPAPAQARPQPQPPKPAPAKALSGSGPIAVQVAAVGSHAAAQRAAAAAAKLAPRGAVARVEPATVDGRGFYRALVRGFDTRAEASRFCKVLTARGEPCFVR